MKADFSTLLKGFLEHDPTLAIDRKREKILTPSQDAIEGVTRAMDAAQLQGEGAGYNGGQAALGADNPNRFAIPNDPGNVMDRFPGSGREVSPMPNSTNGSNEEEGYASPIFTEPPQGRSQYQDITIGPETLTPRTGQTLGDMNNQPVEPNNRASIGDIVKQRQDALWEAQNAPIEKQDKWKDWGAYFIQGLDAALNPGQGKKIEGFGKIKHDRAVREAEAELGIATKQRDVELDATRKQAQIDELGNQTRNRNIKTLLDMAENERKQVEAEAKAGNWTPREENGVIFKHYPDGREEPLMRDGQQVRDLLKTPVKAIVDGQEVWTLGKDVIDRKIAEEYRNAQMAMDADKYNAEELNDYSDKLNKWADDAQDAQNKVTQLRADGQGKLREADQLDPYLNAEKIAQLRREGASMIRQADEYKMPTKPKPPKGKLSAPKLGGKTVSEAEIQALVQKTGKTEKEIRAMAKRDGYTIQ